VSDLSREADAAFEAELAVAEALSHQALLPYQKLLPVAELALLRDVLIDALMTHPNVSGLVTRLARRRKT
jgi:hypothetical protein